MDQLLLSAVADQNPEVDLFAGMKKKKKKVVALDVEEAPAAAPAAAEPTPEPAAAAPTPVEPAPAAEPTPAPADEPAADGEDLFADLKKKKKKKKEIPLDLDGAAINGEASSTPTVAPEGLDGMKKKKSKKQVSDFAKELDELDAENEDDGDGELGDDPFDEDGANGDAVESGKEAWVLEGRDPTYPELLKRFFTLLHQHNPELAGEKRRYQIVPPQVAREGTKKTVFANITDICRRMHRPPEHVISYLYSELGTQGTIDGAQRLVMKGRFTQKQMETVLRRYISEYVTCKICKSPDTLLSKDNRLYFMTCEVCGSRLSVSAIKAGYQAQGKRVKPVG